MHLDEVGVQITLQADYVYKKMARSNKKLGLLDKIRLKRRTIPKRLDLY